ncbi:MAG TPA: HAMP domain-containing sensor histidine kinase [Polyangiaceae bacterium]|jgi:signal transduction histidine kinase|nr:HAMP domain-containing sensor histidine kinase [Polyangiaceae bacterium]
MRFRRFVSARLHRQLFMWLGITILFTGMVVSAVVSALRPDSSSMESDVIRIQHFIGQRFQRVWDQPAERHELTEDIARTFEVDLTLFDAQKQIVDQVGARCDIPQFSVIIPRGGAQLGTLAVCIDKRRRVPGFTFVLAIAAACLTLWGASGALARKLVRPLSDLIRVTREIGSGNLMSRVRLGRHHLGEVGVLADSVNDMARRIERQLNDQRELLAAVSHEIRSPLARLRVLVELLRGSSADAATLDKVEREIIEVDDLIGKLLASSRLDFGTLNLQALEPCELIKRAIERANLEPTICQNEVPEAKIKGDPTLLDRAFGNLLENAQKHAGGVESVIVSKLDGNVCLTVNDRGPGFPAESLTRAFEAFYRGDGSSHGLGLGLALVQRIARAHGGRAWAENRADGGASVHFEIPEAA